MPNTISIHTRRMQTGGYMLVTALIFFLSASGAVIASISDAVFRETKTVRNEYFSKQSYFSSESGAEDVAYRMKVGKNVDATETLSLATTTIVTTTSLAADGSTDVESSADANGTQRNVTLNLNQGTGTSFPYALQSGVGGIDLSGGATITGDIYTTGSIRGCSTCTITGNAVAAGKSTSNVDQDNSLPATPTGSITFANSNSTQDLAQSFSVGSDLSLTGLELYVKKVGNPSNATIRVVQDNGGKPTGTILASGTLSSSLVSTAYAWMNITLTANPQLTTGATYWVLIDANTSATSYYIAAANSTYGAGEAKLGRNSTWSSTGSDAYFKVYIGENQEGITGDDQWNPIPVGSAYSYKASYVSSAGALYCQIGVDNNKACDTSRGDPAVESHPISSVLLDAWKNEATTSVYTGNYTVGVGGATLGPKKINGNLIVGSGGNLQVSGAIWVTGNITIDGGATIVPSDPTKSYVIIADGTILLTGGAEIYGSTGSHILLASTNTADPAITINGGANDTILYAPNGGLYVSGGAEVNAAAATHITADGGSNIIYDPDVSQLNLTSSVSPSTPFSIKSWKETE